MPSKTLKQTLLATALLALALPAASGMMANPVDPEAPTQPTLALQAELDARALLGHTPEPDPAFADAILTGASALDLAYAMAKDTGTVFDATFVSKPPSGTPTAVSTTALTTFPSSGGSFAILTSGNAAFAPLANTHGSTSANNGGGAVRGTSDRDVVILKLELRSLPLHVDNCLSVDYRFLTEEYPEWVGTRYNDAFVAETGTNTWTTVNAPPQYSILLAPTNFAFDDAFDLVSLNTLGQPGFTAAAASGTTYDGATPHYRAYAPLPPPTLHASGTLVYEVFFSIFDQGDNIYDSAVFLDNLDLFFSPACTIGPATKVAN